MRSPLAGIIAVISASNIQAPGRPLEQCVFYVLAHSVPAALPTSFGKLRLRFRVMSLSGDSDSRAESDATLRLPVAVWCAMHGPMNDVEWTCLRTGRIIIVIIWYYSYL